MEDLQKSITEYNEQLTAVNEALVSAKDDVEAESLLTLKADLNHLIQLTQESLETLLSKERHSTNTATEAEQNHGKDELEDEYALFMQEMAKSGAYDDKPESSKNSAEKENDEDSDIEDELSSLLGMRCAVYHTHKWGGQPSLHNAMVSAVVPRQNDHQFQDLQVRVLFTHPTHAEMLPCPFFLDGDCRFSDEQCRYSHGAVIQLSNLKEAIEPNFESLRVGSRILLKLKPPDDEDISLTKKSTERYHLWHRAIVKNIDFNKKTCIAKLEHGVKSGEKRKSTQDECYVKFEDIFPLNNEDDDSESEDSISDTEYTETKALRLSCDENNALLVEKSLQNNAPAMGEWERHTRGIGSKLMLAMGYVPGTGLGAASDGRLQPVEARVLPVGSSLDHCMTISERFAAKDPLKVEQKLKKLQKKEEERNRKAYEREKERERRNVFNFLNKTLGNKPDCTESTSATVDIKQSTSKDLNIEQFRITEETRKLEREIVKLNSSLARNPPGSGGHLGINAQISERKKELDILKSKEQAIAKEQKHRKDKQKMTVF